MVDWHDLSYIIFVEVCSHRLPSSVFCMNEFKKTAYVNLLRFFLKGECARGP